MTSTIAARMKRIPSAASPDAIAAGRSRRSKPARVFSKGASAGRIHSLGCALTAVLQASESSAWCSCRQLRSLPLPRGALAQNFCASAEQAPRSAPLPVPGWVVCATAVPANKTAATAMMSRSALMPPSVVPVYRDLTARRDSIRRPAMRPAVRCSSDTTIPGRHLSHQAVRGVYAMALATFGRHRVNRPSVRAHDH